MNILITGGAGYIGSHINKELHKKGFKTIIVDNLVNGHIELVKWGEFFKVDLLNKKALEKVFRYKKVDAVIHLAAFAYVGESVNNPHKYYVNNVISTLNLLEVMLENGVNKLIFSSTCTVYGKPKYIPIDEYHPKDPINPYGRSKLSAEHIIEDFSRAYGLKYVLLRYFNVAGADPDGEIGEWHDPETHLIPNVIDASLGVKPYVEVFGTNYNTKDGSCVRDFVHVSDLAEAHIKALIYIFEGGDSCALNLGTGEGYSVMQIIELAERITGKRIPMRISPRRPGDPPVLVADPSRARKVLDWKPRYDIEDILKTAIRWHRKLRGQ